MDGSNMDDGMFLSGNKRYAPGEGEGEKNIEENEFELYPQKLRVARKMRCVMANRRSARESRERRKKLLTDLQDSVQTLTTDNTTLTKENLSLRRELASLIEQSGGPSALSMIPNIQSLLESTQNFPNLSSPTQIFASTDDAESTTKKI